MFPRRQNGVALIVTVIMLSVITFMTVTFLAVSRRDRNSVTTATDQTTAHLAAAAALERATAEALAPILAATNAFNFDLLVSTNYINWNGFDAAAVDHRTNVNFDYRVGGGVLTANDALQNLANLLYSPRPPVFVVTNRATGSNEFRFYLDLNRDGRYDPSGVWPVISPNLTYYDSTGAEVGDARLPPPPGVLSNFFKGDPEWIGQLARPEFPHSATNPFTSRIAYFVIPAGKTLDVNYIHNQAYNTSKRTLDQFGRDFHRDQGVGSWEINLAAFLYDLNTNLYAWGGRYDYNPLLNTPTAGNAFVDAGAIYRHRLNGPGGMNYNLRSVSALFGPNGVAAFGRDMMDGYSTGPVLTSYAGFALDPDVNPTDYRNRPWPGADNTNHFFTTQDFFDTSKTASVGTVQPTHFTDTLLRVGTNVGSYDRYTYSRMLEQLGTDSAPEPDTKLNLNYINVGGFKATNFVSWDDPVVTAQLGRPGSEVFFTSAIDRLLRAEFPTNSIDAGNIPVFVNNVFQYTPALHRMMQMAANLWDSTTNRAYTGAAGYPYLPTVFRPMFELRGTNIYITNYFEVATDTSFLNPPNNIWDLGDSNQITQLLAGGFQPGDSIYNVPLVIGAKKGLPNFNEFAVENAFQIVRKLQFKRAGTGVDTPVIETNQLHNLAINSVFGLEGWNSYAATYSRDLQLRIFPMEVTAMLTNESGILLSSNRAFIGRSSTIPLNTWRGYDSSRPKYSFQTLMTNTLLLTNVTYRQTGTPALVPQNNTYESGFHVPRLWLMTRSRVRMVLLDSGRIVDYVALSYQDEPGDVAAKLMDDASCNDALDGGAGGAWCTNRLNNLPGTQVPTRGIMNQVCVGLGLVEGDWTSYKLDPIAGLDKDKARGSFFYNLLGAQSGRFPGTYAKSNIFYAPFNPSRVLYKRVRLQANDPLVHYTISDLTDLQRADNNFDHTVDSRNSPTNLLGVVNGRYQPWGGNVSQTGGDPNPVSDALARDMTVKDAGVTASDAWQFPTNKFPTLGWLGRVHRGTPWQTIYLKASDVATDNKPDNKWKVWTGNANYVDAMRARPVEDRKIFDLFTVAFSDNAARGQLPINQSGLAAWSAVFSGLVALTNSATDAELANPPPPQRFDPWIVGPVGADNTNSPLWKIVAGINRTRASANLFPQQTFTRLGDILAVPELTETSPFLNLNDTQRNYGLKDAVYEWLPQQLLSLVRLGEPRFVVYSYGQTLRPAPRSMVTSGPFRGMYTNYQITAEVATRTVLRIEGAPTNSHAVVESYNVLPPD